jgi:hypothetical protein
MKQFNPFPEVSSRYGAPMRWQMSTQHTPGPWVARQTFSNRWDIEVLREGLVPLTIGHVSTAVLGVGTHRADLTEANARLIAAAPDLLEALRDAYCHITLLATGQRPPCSNAEASEAVGAVIAKATGSIRGKP